MNRHLPCILSAGILLLLAGCQRYSLLMPENVLSVLEKAGNNRAELQKVFSHYHKAEDSLKLKAAYFLVGNMSDQAYVTFAVADTAGNEIGFNVLDYRDYDALSRAWDSIILVRGPLIQKRTGTTPDYEIITAEYLISNIDLAFEAWNYPWARRLTFNQFCEYILPYRSTNEPLESWRKPLMDKYAWVLDSVKDREDPLEACVLINNDIRSWFRFDPRFYEHATDQGYSEMTGVKMGRCEDMTNLAIYSMRAMGVPVMSDFTPYWAKTGNNHAWNAILDKEGKVIIFMGGESNPGEYRLDQDKAKVYRKTFAVQKGSLASLIKEGEKVPKYIDRSNIIDVTEEYIPVSDIQVLLDAPESLGQRFAYLCVFNTGDWCPIHWALINSGMVTFTRMGRDIAYLPAYYIEGKVVPATLPLIPDREGRIQLIKADPSKTITLRLSSTTKRITLNTTDNIEKVFLNRGGEYELFYWDAGWISLGKQVATGGPLVFKNVPAGALYWLVSTKLEKDRPERIFIVNEKGETVWY